MKLRDVGGWSYAVADVVYPAHTVFGGKWLVFTEELDIWEDVKAALEDGVLGRTAKLSLEPRRQYVICVYTYDANDRGDVMRVRDGLRGIGVTEPIPYKTDAATRNGEYGPGSHLLRG